MPNNALRHTDAEHDCDANTQVELRPTVAGSDDTVTLPPSFDAARAGQTTEGSADPPAVASASETDSDFPAIESRYRLLKVLGVGGFGRVFLAHDSELDRRVAVKVPHRNRISSAADVDLYLNEARAAASLDHPGIVPVYDVRRTGDGRCYIVSKFIEGSDLAKRVRADRPSFRETSVLIASIAEALDHAHQRKLVHRDVKSHNILLDRGGRAYLTDFGLALRDDDFGRGPAYLGTPEYMSPEQARGEGHLVDARTDIFSLGVVLYELLTGVRPYRGITKQEILDQIKNDEIRPPRDLDETVPHELDRICLKALAKRLSERYSSAADLADDLRRVTELMVGSRLSSLRREPAASGGSSSSGSAASGVIPKGLRSFDASDAESYLSLLPGPHDRDGLPTSLSFWKRRIGESDPDRVFRTGLVYGPSGCGKSSFVKAGLIPRLSQNVVTVLLEATARETPDRLYAAIRRNVPSLRGTMTLPQLLGRIRRGGGLPEGQKLLIILDQFEQWLHAPRDDEDATLIAALRQCDGERVQCLLVVRDDFWMAVTRFLQELDVRLIDGDNSAAVDLFDPRHARRVLREFGQAFDAIPRSEDSVTRDQAEFLEQAVNGLTREGKVIPVQLSLFAEMVKGKEWTPTTLRAVGGPQGIGVAFLEETFSSASAPIEHRVHERAARNVLESLLPGQGTLIKGHMRAVDELLHVSGYVHRPRDFEELRRILDIELHLITPVDDSAGDMELPEGTAAPPSYQLTHDYLVPALREWLTQKQMETRRGRARLRLSERAGLWEVKHERKQLPSLWEWAGVRLLTRRSLWSDRERAMMGAAARYHARRSAAAIMIAGSLGIAGFSAFGRYRASELAQTLFASETNGVPRIIAQMRNYRFWLDRPLRSALKRDNRDALHASLALLPVDSGQVTELKQQLLRADPDATVVIIDALEPHKAAITDNLWSILQTPAEDESARLRAACALARYAPNDRARWERSAAELTRILISENLLDLGKWNTLLRPAHMHLMGPLTREFRRLRGTQKGSVAASILADLAYDQAELLAELIQDADSSQLMELASDSHRRDAKLLSLLQAVVNAPAPPDTRATSDDSVPRRQANAGLALIALGRTDLISQLLANRPDPRLRTYLLRLLPTLGMTPDDVIGRVAQEADPGTRQALILLLDRLGRDAVSKAAQDTLAPILVRLFREDADPGVHSAAEWLLRRWSKAEVVERAEEELRGRPRSGERLWYVTASGFTMAIMKGPRTLTIGTPLEEEPSRSIDETRHPVEINRSFAIATKEVTVRQYLKFDPQHPYERGTSPQPECPINSVTWYDAARYCRWLSEQEAIPEDQMCFPKIDEIVPGFPMYPDYLSRTGYRLPTEAEWEAACRAGTTTCRFYGTDPSLLPEYGWLLENSEGHAHPVGMLLPNQLGCFDILGNILEHCLEYVDYYPGNAGELWKDVERLSIISDEGRGSFRVARGGAYVFRAPHLRSGARNGAELFREKTWAVGFRPVRTQK